MRKIIMARNYFICMDCGERMKANPFGVVEGGSFWCLKCGSGKLKIIFKRVTEEELEREILNFKNKELTVHKQNNV